MAAKQPPPLMKKHSQTDLVSRLKTRKILGVGGEDDDGEVHRSKISQVLGNEIKFAVREPLGLRVWQFASAVLFSGIAIMALAFPDQLYDAVFDGAQVTSKTPIRLYGGALLSISLIMWNALYTAEKVIIRWTLLTEACYFGVQFLVISATLAETGLASLGILLLLASRLLFVVISIYYYYQERLLFVGLLASGSPGQTLTGELESWGFGLRWGSRPFCREALLWFETG
uniref:Tumor protein p53-inducible protein 11 n=1 Tax=Felis catus TaxID=9685 RepID=A0ABI7Y552_FELCA